MRKTKVNGIKVILDPKKSDTVAIEVSVFTGSNNEPANIAGISHFLEHMAFEGTKNRTSKQINEEIENIGGELNAMTGNERTTYYVKVPKKFYKKGLDILSDMLMNSIFDKKAFAKEKKVVLEEIKMVTDQPLIYQWILFLKKLYKKHPAKNPVYGSFKTVKSMTRKQMINYFKKYYSVNNLVISVVGDVKNIVPEIKKRFNFDKRKLPSKKEVHEPVQKANFIKKEKRNIQNSYVVLGYKTVPRLHKDSYVLDIIQKIFSRGLSGRIVEEIRVKRGLVYAVNCTSETNKDFGYFCTYLNCAKKNVELCKKIILEEIDKLKRGEITQKEIDIVKQHLEGKKILDGEDTQDVAEDLAFWEYIKDAKLAKQYLPTIRKVTKADVVRVAKKYFKFYTMTAVEPK